MTEEEKSEALDWLAQEIYGIAVYKILSPEQKEVLDEELEFRDNLGWRS